MAVSRQAFESSARDVEDLYRRLSNVSGGGDGSGGSGSYASRVITLVL